MSNAHYIPISPSSHPLNFASASNQPQPNNNIPLNHPQNMSIQDQRMANMAPRNMAYLQARMAAQTQQRYPMNQNENMYNQTMMNRPIQRPFMNPQLGINSATPQQLTNNQIIYSSLNRLIDHINKLSVREESVTIEYWENFTNEFFDENGLCRFLLIDKNNTTNIDPESRKEFNLFKSVIPQYYHGLYNNGITDINYVLGTPRAFFSSNAVLLDCPKTQQIFYMGNTMSVIQIYLRVTFSLNLKIIYWDTKIFKTMDYILKDSLNKYLGELKPEEKTANIDQIIPPVLNEYDLPHAVMIQLEMIDVLSMMTCIMDLSIYNNIDPLEWINEFIIEDNNDEAQNEALKSSLNSPMEEKPVIQKRRKSKGSGTSSPYIKQLEASNNNSISPRLPGEDYTSSNLNESKRTTSGSNRRGRGTTNSPATRGRRKQSTQTTKSRKHSTVNVTNINNDEHSMNQNIQDSKNQISKERENSQSNNTHIKTEKDNIPDIGN